MKKICKKSIHRLSQVSQIEYDEFVDCLSVYSENERAFDERKAERAASLATGQSSPRPKEFLINRSIWGATELNDRYKICDRETSVIEYDQRPYEIIPSSVEYCVNGSTNRVTIGRKRMLVQNKENYSKQDWNKAIDNMFVEKRSISSFSRKSRNRLMRKIGEIDNRSLPLFITLTYPDEIITQKLKVGNRIIDGNGRERWKKDIDNIGKRILREYPNAGFIWRMELKPRKSGENIGTIVPHYHLMMWNVREYDIKNWLCDNWYDLVGSGNPDHLKNGVDVTTVNSINGAMYYTSKYTAKVDDGSHGIETGRLWGVIGRENIPLSEKVFIELTRDQAVALTRLARKYVGIKGHSFKFGMSSMMEGNNLERYAKYVKDQGEL